MLPSTVCWNRSKADPTPFESLIYAFVRAFPTIRRLLAIYTSPRATYVDMPHLLDWLDANRLWATPEPGPILSFSRLLGGPAGGEFDVGFSRTQCNGSASRMLRT